MHALPGATAGVLASTDDLADLVQARITAAANSREQNTRDVVATCSCTTTNIVSIPAMIFRPISRVFFCNHPVVYSSVGLIYAKCSKQRNTQRDNKENKRNTNNVLNTINSHTGLPKNKTPITTVDKLERF